MLQISGYSLLFLLLVTQLLYSQSRAAYRAPQKWSEPRVVMLSSKSDSLSVIGPRLCLDTGTQYSKQTVITSDCVRTLNNAVHCSLHHQLRPAPEVP